MWSVIFSKNFFVFWYSYMIFFSYFTRNLSLGSLSLPFLLCYGMYCCLYSLFHLIYQYIHFWYWRHLLVHFIFHIPNKSFSNNKFFFIMFWIQFYVTFSCHDFMVLLYNSLSLPTHILFGLQHDSSNIFLKSTSNFNAFFMF